MLATGLGRTLRRDQENWQAQVEKRKVACRASGLGGVPSTFSAPPTTAAALTTHRPDHADLSSLALPSGCLRVCVRARAGAVAGAGASVCCCVRAWLYLKTASNAVVPEDRTRDPTTQQGVGEAGSVAGRAGRRMGSEA